MPRASSPFYSFSLSLSLSRLDFLLFFRRRIDASDCILCIYTYVYKAAVALKLSARRDYIPSDETRRILRCVYTPDLVARLFRLYNTRAPYNLQLRVAAANDVTAIARVVSSCAAAAAANLHGRCFSITPRARGLQFTIFEPQFQE